MKIKIEASKEFHDFFIKNLKLPAKKVVKELRKNKNVKTKTITYNKNYNNISIGDLTYNGKNIIGLSYYQPSNEFTIEI